MNPLTETFPTAARVSGEVYQLNSDFRTGLKIMQAFEDKSLAPIEKQLVMCRLLFRKMPDDFPAACVAARKFLDGGEEWKDMEVNTRVFSWTKDAQYIYSAFFQTHGIDLQNAEMHWWKFLALFSDLKENCTFSNICSLRRKAARGKLTPEERETWYNMSDVLSLNETDYTQEEEEKINEFEMLLGG